MKTVKQILLYDNEAGRAQEVRDFLAGRGFDVCLAQSPAQACSMLEKDGPEAALLDIEEMWGRENTLPATLEQFRGKGDTGIIFIISHPDSPFSPEKSPCLADDVLLKPYRPEDAFLRLSGIAARRKAAPCADNELEKLNVLFKLKSLFYDFPAMGEMLDELLSIFMDTFRAETVAVFLKDEEDKIHPASVKGNAHREDLEKMVQYVSRVTMDQKHILFYSDLSREAFWPQGMWKNPVALRNVISIPLEDDARVVGTLDLFNLPPDFHPGECPDEIQFLSQAVREVEKVIGLSRKFDKMKNDLEFAHDELSMIYEISDALTSTLNLDEMLQLIVRNALKSFNAQVTSLMMLDESKGQLSIRFAEGLSEEIIRNTKVKLGEGIAGRVAQSGEPLLLVDMVGIDSVDIEKDFKSALCVPLKMRDEVVGVLNVSKTSRYRFTETDLKLLYNMASLAAQAIEKASLYEDIKSSLEELKSSYMSTVKALSKAIEAKDPYTQGHVDRVAKYGLAIAIEMNSDIVKDEVFRYALVLHDIGKIEIPDAILTKSGSLDDEEMAIMRRHPEAGARILKPVKFFREVGNMVRYHQERFDGKGYPKGLKGEEIPLIARIIAVADAFDAITSDRPYRKARSVEEAKNEIQKHSGTQFDPEVVQALFSALDKKIIP